MPLERFAEKSAQNIIESIQSRKKVPLEKLIWSLGIRHVGEETSIDLARSYGDVNKIAQATVEELQNIKDVGEVMAQSIHEYFQDKQNIRRLDELLKFIAPIPPKKVKNVLGGKTFVVTGTLENFSREEAEQTIRDLGGEVSGSVSKKTDYVVVGENPGSKAQKARELGVKILGEQEFINMIQ